jgi:hypothetical protein
MNDAMRRLEGMVGEWDVTMRHAWFLDSLDVEVHGSATVGWLADAFLLMRAEWESDWKTGKVVPSRSTQEFIFGRDDPKDAFVAFSHDDRETYRVFDMTVVDGEWTLLREDPDFHQRLVFRIEPERLEMRADASDDAGRTWRKDLDYVFVRRGAA